MSDGKVQPMRTGLERKLDYSDYASVPDDRNSYEIVDGDVLVSPTPRPLHQWVSKRLSQQLEAHFEACGLGLVFCPPLAVILSEHDILEPDILVVADPAQISERGVEGPPLLVVEILSPSGHTRDRGVKWRRYEACGVPHYWIADPEARRLECHRLENGAYRLVAQGEGDATLTHPEWSDLRLDLSTLWRWPPGR